MNIANPQLDIMRFVRKRHTNLRAHRCTPVAVNGSRTTGDLLGYYEEPLWDGTLGYYTRRLDDCLQMAVASCVQVPPHLVPDPHIDLKMSAGGDPVQVSAMAWLVFVRWMIRVGVTMMVYPVPPRTERRWIGVVARPGAFEDHCLLMSRGDVLFDPTSLDGESRYSRSDVDYGIVLRKE